MRNILDIASTASLIALSLAMCLAFVRLWRGPSPQDRIVALDLMSSLVVGILTIHAIQSDEYVFLTAGIAIAVISFIGTVAIALFIQKRNAQ
jgi:multicomponent Na+:H+ antiporter subunit F